MLSGARSPRGARGGFVLAIIVFSVFGAGSDGSCHLAKIGQCEKQGSPRLLGLSLRASGELHGQLSPAGFKDQDTCGHLAGLGLGLGPPAAPFPPSCLAFARGTEHRGDRKRGQRKAEPRGT